MSLEINTDNRSAEVELLKEEDNNIKISIDGKQYDVDIIVIEPGVYSILLNDKSYNIELKNRDSSKNYSVIVDTLYNSYDIEIVDSESKYQKNRQKDDVDDENVTLSTPIPGKVVKILVKVGDNLKAGETAIIVEAMKMQSEYKVKKDRVVKEILVKEGDSVDGNQPLIIVE